MSNAANSLSLAGEWHFAMDREDAGVNEAWYRRSIGTETVKLPGSMAENGKGDEVTPETPFTGRILDRAYFTDPRYDKYRQPGNIKFPCWLTPLKFYKGVAWYQQDIEIPGSWTDLVVHLELERTHWVTTVWIDGESAGTRDSLGTPHQYVLGRLKAGSHTLTIRVDNRVVIDVGEDAHSLSDQSQGSWNGLIGELRIKALPPAWIDNLQIYPAKTNDSVRVVALVKNLNSGPISGQLEIVIREKGTENVISPTEVRDVNFDAGNTAVEFEVKFDEPAHSWDEFSPVLYEVVAILLSAGQPDHEVISQFGFRDFAAKGRRLFMNARSIFLRGTLECAVFPLSGYPPTDRASWDRIMTIAKDHGLNHIRFHSWCPPEAAFQAADEAGIIFSVECSSWAIVGENQEYDEWLYREADEMLRAFGNHPSFCMMLYGNEPYGDLAAEFLGKWVDHYKAKDQRRLFSSGTAWPMIPESQFNVWMNPRIQLWDQNLDSRINSKPPETVTDYTDIIGVYPQPVISHEIGQWCVYPNFDEIPKYTGILRAYNFEIFRDFLEESGMGDQARDFLNASGKLQVLCYKEEIESALRTPHMAGFQLLDLHDFPGQGSALVGVLDAFWDEKGYITPEEFRRFCSRTVPLAKMPKRVFTNAESFEAEILLAHFDKDALPAGEMAWSLTGDAKPAYSGEISTPELAAGELHRIGNVVQSLQKETRARKLTLEIGVPNTAIKNDWDIWVYPRELDVTPPQDVLVTGRLDTAVRERLAAGGKVLLMPDNRQILGDSRGQVPPGFSSIFWNTAWTTGQEPHTLGILCDPGHPALAEFPTDYHSNWQWWYPINRSRSMIMNPLPQEVKPIVQVIDDWFTARRLGLVFECQLGGGKLLVSSVDCKDGAPDDIVCRQLLYSLLQYMGSDNFAPGSEVTIESLEKVIHL